MLEPASNKCTCCEADEKVLRDRLDKLILDYRNTPGALIPVLQLTQKLFGFIPPWSIHLIADALGESYSKVYGVITFYSFFSLVKRGKFLIRICLGTACYVRGASEVLTAFKQQLDIDVGQTTKDALFTLDVGRCFGACGLAPVIMINEDVHQCVKPSEVATIIRRYRTEAGHA